MAQGEIFFAKQEVRLGGYTFKAYHQNVFLPAPEDSTYKGAKLHVTGVCPLCGAPLEIGVHGIEWGEPIRELYYERLTPECPACLAFAWHHAPWILACQQAEPGWFHENVLLPWGRIFGWPFLDDQPFGMKFFPEGDGDTKLPVHVIDWSESE